MKCQTSTNSTAVLLGFPRTSAKPFLAGGTPQNRTRPRNISTHSRSRPSRQGTGDGVDLIQFRDWNVRPQDESTIVFWTAALALPRSINNEALTKSRHCCARLTSVVRGFCLLPMQMLGGGCGLNSD